MKIIIYVAAAILSLSLSSNAQYLNFSRLSNGTNAINIPSGEVWQVINWKATGDSNYYYFALDMGSDYLDFRGTGNAFLCLENPASSQPVGLIIVGPATLRAKNEAINTNTSYFMAVKKIVTGTNALPVSATSVVIPQSVSGDVDVKMEQSADNVTWTECLPGTYNSSTVKRFFRLRAVEK